MPIYRAADEEAVLLTREVLAQLHPDLREAGVTVDCYFAHAPTGPQGGEPKGPALLHHGYPALAVVKVTSQKDRVAGIADARVTYDGDRWPDLTDAERRALANHELTHLEVSRDESGRPKLDDCHRPRLKTRPHDAELGVFFDVARRHGMAAAECRAYGELARRMAELGLPGEQQGKGRPGGVPD